MSILLYFVIQVISGNAQQYKYVEPGKIWEGYTTGAFHPPFTFTMHMRHDSILSDGKYYFPKVAVNEHGQHLQTTFWREDNQKVYRKLTTNEPEQLIYDWTLVEGDTLFKNNFSKPSYAIVDSLGTSILSGRKIWFLTMYCDSMPRGSFNIIEGIGASRLEFAFYDGCIVYETNSRVNCVESSSDNQQTCLGYDNLNPFDKQWVTSHKNTGSNVPIYTRYMMKKYGLDSEKKQELLVTIDRQGDNNWATTGRIFSTIMESEIINGKEYKLFDYSLHKGDTFKLEFPNEPTTFMIVDSTDFVLLLDQREYKRLMLKSPNAPGKRFVWVEGVGDIDRFVFYRPTAYGTETTDYKLTCYYYNYNIYYRAPNVFNCDLKSAADVEIIDLSINIFPNPATDYLHLVTDESLDIEIRSIIGQRVKSISIDGEDDIDISLLEKGMYVLVFRNRSSKVLMSKLFVKL